MGPTSIKMYDKAGIVLRIETTTNDPSWFSHYRTVEHRDGSSSHELAPLKKSIYSLHDLRKFAVAANRRTLAFLSALDDPTASVEWVGRLSEKVTDAGRSYRGLNFFSEQDLHLLELLVRGECTISGLRNANLREHLPGKSPGQVSRSSQPSSRVVERMSVPVSGTLPIARVAPTQLTSLASIGFAFTIDPRLSCPGVQHSSSIQHRNRMFRELVLARNGLHASFLRPRRGEIQKTLP